MGSRLCLESRLRHPLSHRRKARAKKAVGWSLIRGSLWKVSQVSLWPWPPRRSAVLSNVDSHEAFIGSASAGRTWPSLVLTVRTYLLAAYLLTYLFACLLAYLLAFLFTYLLSYFLTYLITCLLIDPGTHLHTCLLAHSLTCILTY